MPLRPPQHVACLTAWNPMPWAFALSTATAPCSSASGVFSFSVREHGARGHVNGAVLERWLTPRGRRRWRRAPSLRSRRPCWVYTSIAPGERASTGCPRFAGAPPVSRRSLRSLRPSARSSRVRSTSRRAGRAPSSGCRCAGRARGLPRARREPRRSESLSSTRREVSVCGCGLVDEIVLERIRERVTSERELLLGSAVAASEKCLGR